VTLLKQNVKRINDESLSLLGGETIGAAIESIENLESKISLLNDNVSDKIVPALTKVNELQNVLIKREKIIRNIDRVYYQNKIYADKKVTEYKQIEYKPTELSKLENKAYSILNELEKLDDVGSLVAAPVPVVKYGVIAPVVTKYGVESPPTPVPVTKYGVIAPRPTRAPLSTEPIKCTYEDIYGPSAVEHVAKYDVIAPRPTRAPLSTEPIKCTYEDIYGKKKSTS